MKKNQFIKSKVLYRLIYLLISPLFLLRLFFRLRKSWILYIGHLIPIIYIFYFDWMFYVNYLYLIFMCSSCFIILDLISSKLSDLLALHSRSKLTRNFHEFLVNLMASRYILIRKLGQYLFFGSSIKGQGEMSYIGYVISIYGLLLHLYYGFLI